jgi:phosphoglycerate dehydrogenase-like enzyme
MKVAIASRSFSKHPILRAELLACYPDATFNDAGKSLAGAELIDFLKDHDGAVTALERLDDTVFEALPRLAVIGKYGVGLDMLDLAAMNRRGIRLGWTGGVNRRSVSELVICMAISLLRHVPKGNLEVRAGGWRQLQGRHLSERVVGIIGCGHIGQDLAPLLRAFGCTVLAHDLRDFPEFYAAHGVEKVGLDELLARADVVTLHLPLDGSTTNLVSADKLALMRPEAILINCARGGLIDEAALKQALVSGKLAGAGLDVFAGEPPTDRELLALPNLLATPHIGGSAEEAVLAMGRAAIAGLSEAEIPSPGSEVWRAAGLPA